VALSSDDTKQADEESSRLDDEKLLKVAQDRFRLAEEAEMEIRRLALEDLEFRAGKQWPDMIEADRQKDGRPCLVINRIPQFIQQVTNDQRQNRPAIKVHPVDDKGDVETGKIYAGMIRHIEYNSNADYAYDTGFDSAVTGGFGYWRILTGYCDPMSFDQEIMIKRIRNPLSVFLDPYSQEPDGSDADWGFIVDDISEDAYREKYPNSKLCESGDWDSIGNQVPGWVKSGSARIAEYFYRESKLEDIVLLSNGRTMLKKDLPQDPGALGEGVTIIQERKSLVPVIRWCKLNAVEKLEETEWLGKWIPIVPVYGTELSINGKRVLEGIVRNAKDSQRMYNYWASAETEAIALAPRTPFIVAKGQIKGYEQQWETANRRNHAYLEYNPIASGGTPVPPPQRNVFEPAVGAITNARALAADDLKATTGIYDSALGAQGNENSGIAIQRRNVQSQTSNFHFIDNLTRSLRHTGRILVDLIPKVYDTARMARIIGDDGDQKVVLVNGQPEPGSEQDRVYQLNVGKYDVTVDTGPSFASKRQEAAASMMDLTKAYPQIAQVAGDLIVKNMDWPGAQDIAERLKKTLPPGIADDPTSKNQPVPPQIQAQMQQMNQMIDHLTHHLNEANHAIETKKVELESRERIEMAKIHSNIELEMAKMGSQESIALLKHEIAAISQRLKLLHFDQPIPDLSSGMQADGAPMMGAGQPTQPQDPTGGVSPGTPME
jgi:hypothetical protein